MTDLSAYWESIPTRKASAATYAELCAKWECCERKTRAILHELSLYDSGDDFILIRSSSVKGFYRTDNKAEIEAYKRECLARGRCNFAPIKKINRVLSNGGAQLNIENNLRVMRESAGLTQAEVCEKLKIPVFDKFLLSKMENNCCLPTPYQLELLANLYGCNAAELVGVGICIAQA